MTSGLQSRIVTLSVLSVTLVSIITFLTILYLYHSHAIKTIDQNLLADVHAVKQLLKFNYDGTLDLRASDSAAVSSYAKYTNIYYLVSSDNLRSLKRSTTMINIEIPETVKAEGYQYFTFYDEEYRIYGQKYFGNEHSGDVDLYIHVLRPMEPLDKEVEQLFILLLLMLPLPIFLTGIGSWWIARHTIQPIHTLIKTVETINSESLDTQIPVVNVDEVGQLTGAFNTFLLRLNNAFNSLRRFTSDASHELRTPLTVIRTQAEVMLQKPRDITEYQQNIVSTLEEISRLEYLTDTLLQLTRADAGITKLSFSKINISNVIEKWIDNFLPLADDKNISLKFSISNDIILKADKAVFECIIINLLNNAIQYTPVKGEIKVTLSENFNQISLMIEDSGPGIPDTEKINVFDRFKRLQQTRHASAGSGLGLSVVQWVVKSHHGKVWIDDSPLGGCVFKVVFNKS